MKNKRFEYEMLNVKKTTIKRIQEIKKELNAWEDYLKTLNEIKSIDDLEKQTKIHLFLIEGYQDEVFSNKRCEEEYN